MMIETTSIEDLERHVRTLADADSAPAVFRGLLDAMKMVAPSGAIFLVRQGQIKGWNSFGYSDGASTQQKGFSSAAPQSWLGNPETEAPAPDFGQDQAEQVVRTASVRGRPIALVMVHRNETAGPWFPDMLNVLVTVAQLRLAYTLLEKKLRGAQPPVATPVLEPKAADVTPQVAQVIGFVKAYRNCANAGEGDGP